MTELFPAPSPDSSSKEYVEFYNDSDKAINLEKWRLKDANLEKSGETDKSCVLHTFEIKPGEYKVFYLDDCEKFTISLNNDGDDLNLYNPTDAEPVSGTSYTSAEPNSSWSLDGEDWRWAAKMTPGEKNDFNFPEPPPEDDSGGSDTPPTDDGTPSKYNVYLNEILPNPKGADKSKEFVEIYNAEDSEIDLSGWALKYSSSTYHFPDETKIGSKKYLTLYNQKDFKFSLGNSGERTLRLIDTDGHRASFVSYNGAKENASYDFDGALWHWSRFLTPGKANKFNHAPKIKIKSIKNAYVGVPVAFSASTKDKDKDKLKFVWDFGDGHKSYIKNPNHTYLKDKKYKIIFTVDDGSEKFAKTLSLKVKKYPKQDLKIVQINPNPAGNDTGKEKIILFNAEKKQVNLKGWKIATGKSEKKMINHIINTDFFIAAGKTAELSHQNAYFYLNNTGMKLELRYPNGKTADKMSYAKEKIAEDEIYRKVNGKWAWIAPPTETKLAEAAPATPVIKNEDIDMSDILGKYSADPEWRKKKENRIILASFNQKLSTISEGQVLGTSIIRETENYYTFTPYAPEKHWVVKLWEDLLAILNSFINNLLLQF